MSPFVDSCFFVALLNNRDENHVAAKKILNLLRNNQYGTLVTTDYIVDEVLTTIWGYTHRKDLVINAYNITCNKPEFVQFKKINDQHFNLSWQKWERMAEWSRKPLSFTDCTILAYMELEKVEHLVTFDTEFEGLVNILEI